MNSHYIPLSRMVNVNPHLFDVGEPMSTCHVLMLILAIVVSPPPLEAQQRVVDVVVQRWKSKGTQQQHPW